MASPLLEPFRFANGVVAANRVWLAPMTNLQSHPDGSLSIAERNWLLRRADGGFGVIQTCASHVSEDGQGWQGEMGIHSDRHLPGLSALAADLVARGATGIVQLFHAGLRADSKLTGLRSWSASAGEEGGVAFQAGSHEDIQRVIGEFRDAAVRACAAGFHGVELHGAHGYLFGQFLSVIENRRSDGWGGSLANRARLLRDTVRAIRAAVPSTFVVGVRLSPEDSGHARGLDLDESLAVAGWLCQDGVDFLHLSLHDAARNTTKRPRNHAVTLFREAVERSVPLVVAGQIWTRAQAEELLELGAGGVALARCAIANPDWPRQIEVPGWQPRRPPLSVDELVDRGLSRPFAINMGIWWPGFVDDAAVQERKLSEPAA
ncbi:MAG: NADH:flavin oxidoreductase [Proteobacteria bacterium]|nr:NADH:flavin oxidoreductase [Pseudomonadota bacterium]